jgi:hypothetical protein
MALNLVFICGTIFIAPHLYSKIKLKLKAIPTVAMPTTDSLSTAFYDASEFEIIGKLPDTETYTRLPQSAENTVRKIVWEISKSTAGISVRFASNSTKIAIRWKLLNNTDSPNMTAIMSKGLDLYAFTGQQWLFVGAAKPTGKFQNEADVIVGMDTLSREYLLNLPLYDGVSKVEIGIDTGAFIGKPVQKIINTAHPIVFYGTSITQGASASRPGLCYTALLERYFNTAVINLGFSGNGRFEKEIAKYIMTAQPSVIVLDCTPNSGPAVIAKNLPKTIDCIHAANKNVPIILVESLIRDFAVFKQDDKTVFGTMSYIGAQNEALKKVYESKRKTHKNIHYISNEKLVGQDHEATVDGTHFNDLGHYRAYEQLRQTIKTCLNGQSSNIQPQ